MGVKTYVECMDAQKFTKSWPALWLWMQYLDSALQGTHVDLAFTFRKARVDIHFIGGNNSLGLTWEKLGNQALLTFSEKTSLPKRRVEVLKSLPNRIEVKGVRVLENDRFLRIDLADNYYLLLGFFPGAMNVSLYQEDAVVESFLKQEQKFQTSGEWLAPGSSIPDSIPGDILTPEQLREASKGICFDQENGQLEFGTTAPGKKLMINELVIEVLRHSHKPKLATSVSLSKTGKTVLKRWRSKLSKVERELEQADTWPELQTRLQAFQIAQGMGQSISQGEVSLPAEMSPTGEAVTYTLESGTTLNRAIELTAKKIRKFKGKLSQLQTMIPSIESDITALQNILNEEDSKGLQEFLQKHGETLDKSGRQQTERKPYKKYTSPGGFDILVGRASTDNDVLTFKVANKNDWWFHARQVRGTHVILRTGNQTPQQSDILAAASHAARNSKAKHSGIVVVQYCQRKHLSKPKGSHPGTVLVHQEQSITVNLDSFR